MESKTVFNNIPCKPGHFYYQTVPEYVIVTDDNGITGAFAALKKKLSGNQTCLLSFIYAINEENPYPLYINEIRNFEKRFSPQLLVYVTCFREIAKFNKELLEVIINCNTVSSQLFKVFGNEEFVKSINDRLCFLNIDHTDIETSTF